MVSVKEKVYISNQEEIDKIYIEYAPFNRIKRTYPSEYPCIMIWVISPGPGFGKDYFYQTFVTLSDFDKMNPK